MPTDLTGQNIDDTFDQLLHVDGGVTSTTKQVYDGDGTGTGLKVSTTHIELANGTAINEFSTDTTLGGDSDDAVPTEKAVKAYVDANSGGASALDDLSDVTITTPSDGQALIYDSVSGGWVNDTVAGGSYTNEDAQDAVGSILTDTATIDFTYNDGANTITADVIPSGITVTDLSGVTTVAGSLLDDTSVGAMRTTLGLGTAATSNTGDFAAASHTHGAADIVSGTLADARIAQSSVTQHQAALTITESQISDLGSYITASSTNTLTNKTFDANGTGNSITNIEVADIASAAKTGADTMIVTGTAGTSGNLAEWNADGDLVDSGSAASDFAGKSQTDFISGVIEAPTNQDYKLIVKIPYAGTITETTTISGSGTCTATFKVNSTALGGTANSVSIVEQSQAHASSNTFTANDDIVLTVSSNLLCTDMSFTIKFTRTLA